MPADRAHEAVSRRQGERGAVLPLVAMLMGVLVTSVSFSVDVGRLSSKKRDVQSVVDLVAIDAARVLDGSPAVVMYPLVEAAARESALRNDFVVSAADTLDVQLGTWDWSERLFTPLGTTSLDSPNAVHIGGSADVPFFFSTLEFAAARSATAVRRLPGTTPDPDPDACAPGDPACGDPGTDSDPDPDPCIPGSPSCPFGSLSAFSVGSTLVGLQGDLTPPLFIQQKVDYLNTLLPAEVKTPLTKWSVSLAGYEGLAAADVTLDQLRVTGGFASVDQLLDASVTYGQLMGLTVAALSNEPGGGASAEAMGALGIAVTATSSQTFKVGDLLKVQQGMGGSAGSVAVNVADLVVQGAGLSAALELANGGSAISVPISTAIPGVITSTLKMAFIEPPAIAIGPPGRTTAGSWITQARTAQVRGQLDTVYNAAGYGQVSIPIVIDGGEAIGALESIRCMPLDDETETGIGVDTSALNAYIGTATSMVAEPLVVADATLVDQILFTITGRSTVTVPGVSDLLSFFGPYDYDNSATVSQSGPAVNVGTQLDFNLHTDPVSSEAGMKAALLPYLLLLDDLVLKPLSSAVGLELAGARVTAFDIDCGAPVLVT